MKNLFLIILLFTFVGISNAQEKSKTNESVKVERKTNMDEWSKELGLTKEQEAKIQQINDDFKVRKQALRASGTADDFNALNDEKQAAIDAVLTPDQRAKQTQIHEKKVAEKQQKADTKAKK